MSHPVHITGAGIVSAIGLDKASTLESLVKGVSGVEGIKYLETSHSEFPVGEVKASNETLCSMVGIEFSDLIPRTALLGMVAMKEAIAQAGLNAEDIHSASLISGTTVGGMDKTEKVYGNLSEKDECDPYISSHGCGKTTEIMADVFGKFAYLTTVSTACSSAANSILMGVELIRLGKADIVVAGGSESLSKFHLNGFNSLMILDTQPCRPFDSTRAGLNLGEGAAFVVLESDASVRRRGSKVIGEILGCCNACDAFHQTASSPDGEGAFLAMTGALADAGISAFEIDYVNAHGTGTPNNDLSESAALRRVFGEGLPPISSTKSYTGHTTSASGSIEAVISLLCIQNGIIPTGLRCDSPDPQCIPQVTESLTGKGVRKVLSNSFGFGGNDSSLVISEPIDSEGEIKINDTKAVYVKSAAAISSQAPLCDDWMTNSQPISDRLSFSQNPDWKPFFSPMEGRRLSKILKRALATSLTALKSAGVETPGGVITGTGLGCIENSEVFLSAICKEGEQCLKPTFFMNSTHNTVGSTVGIRTKCHGYNTTISHQSISFESALLDAMNKFALYPVRNLLVGSFDEVTPSFENLFKRGGRLFGLNKPYGEAAASFVLDSYSDGAVCRLCDEWVRYCPSGAEVKDAIMGMMGRESLSTVDLVICADAGLLPECLKGCQLKDYRDIFCEGQSYSALAFYAATRLIGCGEAGSVLIVGSSDKTNVSVTLLKKD